MTRVARIITRLNIGGPAIQAVMLSDPLRTEGFETLLIYGSLSPGEGDMSYLLDGRGVRTAYVPDLQRSISPIADARATSTIYRLLSDFEPHIVHTHTAKAGTVGRAAAALHRRRSRTAARTVHTYHGHVLEGYFRFAGAFVQIERALARGTDRLVTVSPHLAAELQQRYGIGRADQWTVVPLGFDLTPFIAITDGARRDARLALGIDCGTPVVTIVGRLTAIKQHELFLRIARVVHDRVPSAVFLIAGDGERRGELEALAATLGIGHAVRFLGWRKDLTTLYGATDVCVLTSRNEGTPVALIEALAAGVQVVSTDVGGVKDVVNDPVLGRLAPDGAAAALASLVIEALAPGAQPSDAVDRRRGSMLARYSFDRLASDVTALYRTLLGT